MVKKIIRTIFLIVVFILILFKTLSTHSSTNNEIQESYSKIPEKNVCVALTYHRIRNKSLWNNFLEKFLKSDELIHYSISTADFKNQIDELINNGAYFASLDEVKTFRESGSFPDKCVWISFDDADETVYKNAFPYLKEKNIPFTVFIIAGQVGNTDFNNLKMASWNELKEMKDSNLVSFGSHTYNMHYLEDNQAKFLNAENYNDFYNDICKSKDVINEKLDINITSIAYPFGDTNDKLTEISNKAGFTDAFILCPKPITTDNDSYYLNRYMIDKHNFKLIVTPWLENKS